MNSLATTLRTILAALCGFAAGCTRSVIDRARRLGIHSIDEGAREVSVPGTTRTVPLYLLAPGATRGLATQAVRTIVVFMAVLATFSAIWSHVVVARGYDAESDPVGLSVLTVVLWFVALLAVEWSWVSRPRPRPLSADVDRW
jgi:hypothetical protein